MMANKKDKILKKVNERRKTQESALSSLNFRKIFNGRKIPLVTLDEHWLMLFPKEKMTEKMSELCLSINELLKKQGRTVEEIKGYKRYKDQLMQEIMDNMEVDHTILGKLKAKKLDKNHKIIMHINEQLQHTEEELSELPYEIRKVNEELLAETTVECFRTLLQTGNQMNHFKQKIHEYEDRLLEMREEAKEVEKINREMYLYMHDMLGTDIMKQIDEELE
jgi:hypothetical protein